MAEWRVREVNASPVKCPLGLDRGFNFLATTVLRLQAFAA